MTRRLSLRSEHLAELTSLADLTDDELRLAAGGASGTYSGCLMCALSLDRCPTQLACTVFCPV